MYSSQAEAAAPSALSSTFTYTMCSTLQQQLRRPDTLQPQRLRPAPGRAHPQVAVGQVLAVQEVQRRRDVQQQRARRERHAAAAAAAARRPRGGGVGLRAAVLAAAGVVSGGGRGAEQAGREGVREGAPVAKLRVWAREGGGGGGRAVRGAFGGWLEASGAPPLERDGLCLGAEHACARRQESAIGQLGPRTRNP